MDLEKARKEGFVPKHLSEDGGTTKKKLLAVIGIITMFGRKNNRDSIRKAWMPTGKSLLPAASRPHFFFFVTFFFSGTTTVYNALSHICVVNMFSSDLCITRVFESLSSQNRPIKLRC